MDGEVRSDRRAQFKLPVCTDQKYTFYMYACTCVVLFMQQRVVEKAKRSRQIQAKLGVCSLQIHP